MVSAKKSLLKRILITVISIFLVFSTISMVATKIVYDNIFSRKQQTSISVPSELISLTENRKTQEYYSGKNLLTGQLYESKQDGHNTLIVLTPGLNSGADSYLWQINALLDSGWSVFAFDPTGCYSSAGDSAVGFSQVIKDLESTLKYIENNGRFGYNDIVLLGHSRGGYAACCTLASDFDISAVISISGVDSAMDATIGPSISYVGDVAYLNYGFLWLYQAMLFGTDTVNLSAHKEISKSNVPVLIVHGERDTVVPMEKYSIISKRGEIRSDNVEYYICQDDESSGHTNLLFDVDGTANDKLIEKINDFLKRNV